MIHNFFMLKETSYIKTYNSPLVFTSTGFYTLIFIQIYMHVYKHIHINVYLPYSVKAKDTFFLMYPSLAFGRTP